MIFPSPSDDASPKFLLVLSLFQISLGLGWILGYVLLPPTIFCYEQAAEHLLAEEYRTVHPEGLNTENSIVLQPYDYFNKGQTAQLPVVSAPGIITEQFRLLSSQSHGLHSAVPAPV